MKKLEDWWLLEAMLQPVNQVIAKLSIKLENKIIRSYHVIKFYLKNICKISNTIKMIVNALDITRKKL